VTSPPMRTTHPVDRDHERAAPGFDAGELLPSALKMWLLADGVEAYVAVASGDASANTFCFGVNGDVQGFNLDSKRTNQGDAS
jgi:hypothetical protein